MTDLAGPEERGEGLREAAHRVIDQHRHGYWTTDAMDALEDALAATPAPDSTLHRDGGPAQPGADCNVGVATSVPIPDTGAEPMTEPQSQAEALRTLNQMVLNGELDCLRAGVITKLRDLIITPTPGPTIDPALVNDDAPNPETGQNAATPVPDTGMVPHDHEAFGCEYPCDVVAGTMEAPR